MKRTIELTRGLVIKHAGSYLGVAYEINEHSFRGADALYGLTPSNWCTYIYLTEDMHEKFKDKINDAPWNGGQTYYRKIIEDHVDVSPELRKEWSKPFYKIGDDFAHLWDTERYSSYDLQFMDNHIRAVIRYLVEKETEE